MKYTLNEWIHCKKCWFYNIIRQLLKPIYNCKISVLCCRINKWNLTLQLNDILLANLTLYYCLFYNYKLLPSCQYDSVKNIWLYYEIYVCVKKCYIKKNPAFSNIIELLVICAFKDHLHCKVIFNFLCWINSIYFIFFLSN